MMEYIEFDKKHLEYLFNIRDMYKKQLAECEILINNMRNLCNHENTDVADTWESEYFDTVNEIWDTIVHKHIKCCSCGSTWYEQEFKEW
jgi:hypothetical protein